MLLILGAIAVFLIVKSIPSLNKDHSNFFTTKSWSPDADPPIFGIAVLAFGTVLSSVIALILAIPVALGVAIFVVEYAPRRLATWLGYLIDMLATVPSVVYGLWGLIFLVPHIRGFQHFLATKFGWIPIFDDPNNRTSVASRSIFVASVVLAIMVLPVIAAISREVLRQVDPNLKEAALALGATRWVRQTELPAPSVKVPAGRPVSQRSWGGITMSGRLTKPIVVRRFKTALRHETPRASNMAMAANGCAIATLAISTTIIARPGRR